MGSQLFQLPRELRNKIYELANHDDKPFANFEIPWNFLDVLANDEIIEVPTTQLAMSMPTTTIKIPQSVHEARILCAPAVIDYPLAFTCKQALLEHVEEYQHHTGDLPFVAFVVVNWCRLWATDAAVTNEARRTARTSREWVEMLSEKHLPLHSRIRVHIGLELLGTSIPAIHDYGLLNRLYYLGLGLFNHTKKLEFKLHTFVTHVNEHVASEVCLLCNAQMASEDGPAKISIIWPHTALELSRAQSQQCGTAWTWDFPDGWSGAKVMRYRTKLLQCMRKQAAKHRQKRC
jgi:hypothetical protein